MNPVIINGNTKMVALLGNPVRHSLSPVIHNHLFDHMKLPYAYIPFQIDPEHLESAVQCIKYGNFAGANVTVPYKKSVIPFCDSLSELSKLTGTVNTLFLKKGRLHGTTTDADGFFRSLDHAGFKADNENIVIIGNGGTARTLVYALLLSKKPESITIAGRNRERVGKLAEDVNSSLNTSVTWEILGSDSLTDKLKNCGLLINCTSVGMHPDIGSSPLEKELFFKQMNVFDAVYNPSRTMFLKYAGEQGCRAENGLRMLIYQGLESFKYWTGSTPDESLIDPDELQNMISG